MTGEYILFMDIDQKLTSGHVNYIWHTNDVSDENIFGVTAQAHRPGEDFSNYRAIATTFYHRMDEPIFKKNFKKGDQFTLVATTNDSYARDYYIETKHLITFDGRKWKAAHLNTFKYWN